MRAYRTTQKYVQVDSHSRLDPQDSQFSKLSRNEFQISSQELVVKVHSLKLYTTFHSKNYRSSHWARLVYFYVNKVCTLKAKLFASGLLVIVLLKLAL